MHSVSDLTTFSRKTSGDVPPKLVGASTTVVGDKVYLYGGRLVTERRMVTDMYVFDLKTLIWEKVAAPSDDCTPAQRYFHSADSWNQYLIIFGGMGLKPEADDSTEDLCVLNDVCFYDIPARRWMSPSWSLNENPIILPPKPRYAHLSSISRDKLFIIGGQDLDSVWLDDVYIYDLATRTWILKRDYPRHCGTYRSVAVSADLRVHLPQEEVRNHSPRPEGPLFRAGKSQSSAPPSLTSRDSLIHLPYSTQPTDDFPNEIFLYSNYNFTDVKRELEVLTPLPNGEFSVRDASSSMNGPAFPPGLRFPAGAILGTHLIIAGTYLAHSFQSFSVWALNLIDMSWSRIDPGSTLATGSWFRSGLWANANKFIIFGNRQGNLVDDYNRRLLSWDHIAMIDLEAFGIYQPPSLELDIRMQEMGLAALEEGILADFEIVCDDDRRVKCSRKLLEDRWPWFKEQRQLFLQVATKALDTLPLSTTHVALPDVPSAAQEPRSDPRLTPRLLDLSEPYPITLALVQYFYSLALVTPLQHAPAVLSALLVLATNYDLKHLQSLVKHAMHRALSNSTSVGVYEVATLCSCRSLQIRALKTVMLYNQKRPSTRSRQDREGGPGRAPDTNGNGNSGSGGAGDPPPTARPRGMSDAQMRPSDLRQIGGGGMVRGGNVNTKAKDDPDSPLRGTTPGLKSTAPFLERKPRSQVTSSMSSASVTEEAFDEFAIVAELHAPLIIDPMGQDMIEDASLSKPTHFPPQTSRPEWDNLFVDTRLRRSTTLARSGPSPTLTSESDMDETRSKRAIRPTASLPSFHLPNRARHSYRDRDTETPDLTSASRSSLTSSSSAISRNSSLYTPPHSPSIASFIQTEISNPPSSHHLSAINELQNTENHLHHHHLFLHPMEVKSTQTITKTERSGSTSIVRGESGEFGPEQHHFDINNITQHAVPGRFDAHVHHSGANSRTSTVTNLPSTFTRSSAAAASDVTFTQFPTIQSGVVLPLLMLPGTSGTGRIGRSWSFKNKSGTESAAMSKVEKKKEEKRRKKEEARAHRERLAQEKTMAWKEDVAVYGNLASTSV